MVYRLVFDRRKRDLIKKGELNRTCRPTCRTGVCYACLDVELSSGSCISSHFQSRIFHPCIFGHAIFQYRILVRAGKHRFLEEVFRFLGQHQPLLVTPTLVKPLPPATSFIAMCNKKLSYRRETAKYSAKSVHLTMLYVTALTSTNHHYCSTAPCLHLMQN